MSLTTARVPLASRRRVLVGIGALAVVPWAVRSPEPAAAEAAVPEDADFECCADLIEEGVVTRADLVAR